MNPREIEDKNLDVAEQILGWRPLPGMTTADIFPHLYGQVECPSHKHECNKHEEEEV